MRVAEKLDWKGLTPQNIRLDDRHVWNQGTDSIYSYRYIRRRAAE
jgi:hypothetical protein